MIKRIFAGVLGAMSALNGTFMLADGARWYASIPSVPHTGPYNPHFVADIGAAFLAAGLGLLARAWRPSLWPAAAAGAAFLVFHALIHVVDAATGRAHDPGLDIVLVVAPAFVALWAALPNKGEAHA